MRWPWQKRVEVENHYAPVDATLAAFLSPGGVDLASIAVNERSALGVSAFYRAMSLISGTLASLSLHSYRESSTTREKVSSVFDDPDPDGQTPYEWKESAFLHLLLHGKAGALKVRNEGGGLAALPLVHPLSFTVTLPSKDERPAGGVWFDVALIDGKFKRLDANDFWYVPGLSLDGKTGVSLLTYARASLATTIAGDRAAGNMFANGALISGLATPEDDYDITDDLPELRRQVNNATTGYDKAGAIAVINRRLKFTPWTMTASDAQFLQSRQFQIEEISRWTGVPPHLLMQTEKQTSWGTGVEMQDRALGRTVLNTWANRFEQRASRLLAKPRWCEFDFAALERPSPEKEIELDLSQVAAGVMTVDEYRAKRGWKPLPAPDPAPEPAVDEDPEEGAEDAPAE